MLFILVNAHYGGALTMFFTSAPTFPFETVHQVRKILFRNRLFIYVFIYLF